MDNDEKVMVLDENGNEVEARIINIVEIDEQEYLLYAIDKNEEEESLYVNKIIKNENGEEDLAQITDEEEKKNVFEILREAIESLD